MIPPPLLVSFSGANYLLNALREEENEDVNSALRDLIERELPPIASAETISVLFGFSTRFVMSMVNKPGKHYRRFQIRTGKKTREIDSPRVALKVIQCWFGYHLSRAIELADPPCQQRGMLTRV